MRRWGQFYLWKVYSGKAHGGQHIRVDDASIYCETFGSGPPVLVLHGGLGYIEDMSFQIRALAKSHFVIAVDSRGHGRSTGANGPLNYSLMSDDMVKVLDSLNINRVDVVGWSDGGIIGLDLAMRHPERVRRLVAISANYNPDGLGYTPSVEHSAAHRPSLLASCTKPRSMARSLPQGRYDVADAAAIHARTISAISRLRLSLWLARTI